MQRAGRKGRVPPDQGPGGLHGGADPADGRGQYRAGVLPGRRGQPVRPVQGVRNAEPVGPGGPGDQQRGGPRDPGGPGG